nr:unnamed protein product [Digitaria exilis]
MFTFTATARPRAGRWQADTQYGRRLGTCRAATGPGGLWFGATEPYFSGQCLRRLPLFIDPLPACAPP